MCARAGGNPDSNTLISDMATVICLDDYHALDRTGRKEKGVTALAPEAQNFELMYEQVKAMKEGKPVQKPIYNHVTGILDPPEEIKAPKVPCPPSNPTPYIPTPCRPDHHSCISCMIIMHGSLPPTGKERLRLST